MMTAIPVPIGNNDEAPFVAFGDDSQADFALVYGFIILRRDQVAAVENRILALKTSFDIPHHVPLHCRALLHPHPREKLGLGHLSDSDARSIIEKSVNVINKNSVLVRCAMGDLRSFTKIIGNEITLEGEGQDDSITLPVNPDPKAFLSLLMQASFAVHEDGRDGPSASQCKIFAAADPSKVKFIGSDKRQSHNRLGGYINPRPGEVGQLKPSIATFENAPLLQLADIASYLCSRTVRNGEKDRFCQEQFSRIRNFVPLALNLG